MTALLMRYYYFYLDDYSCGIYIQLIIENQAFIVELFHSCQDSHQQCVSTGHQLVCHYRKNNDEMNTLATRLTRLVPNSLSGVPEVAGTS